MATTEHALDHHGDAEATPGLLDFAVNVRVDGRPAWLREALAASLADLDRYPDEVPARHAVAARHGRDPDEVLLTAGAAEAFVLIARALTPRHAVVVHPQFTEPEAALRAAGHPVEQVVLAAGDGFTLDPALIPESADLVMIGNPTNPTSTLHAGATIAGLARPGRTLVVDEAFMDAVPGEPETMSARTGVPALLVVRSLTKTWALPGLRIGYLLGAPDLLVRLKAAQPLWAVSTPALAAACACSTSQAVQVSEAAARTIEANRSYLVARLAELGIDVAGRPMASFVLVCIPGGDQLRLALRERGIAVRRGDTFPGLGPDWLRIAVRVPEATDHLITALEDIAR